MQKSREENVIDSVKKALGKGNPDKRMASCNWSVIGDWAIQAA